MFESDDYNESVWICPFLMNTTSDWIENLEDNYNLYENTAPFTSSNDILYNISDNFPKKRKIIKELLRYKGESKRKKSGKHSKFDSDNAKRKFIGKFLKILVDFFNCKFKIFDEAKQIKEINFSDSKNFQNEKIKILLETNLKNILNGDIKKIYKKYKKEYNNELIKGYEKGNDEQIKSFLNCKLINCIKYFRKDNDIINNNNFSFLKGLEEYYDELVKLKEEVKNDNHKKYLEFMICLINNFENKLGKYSIKENYEMDN